jgi:hypothetical protein
MTDPTATAGLRRAFLAEANRRLARVRSLTHTMLVEHDLMQTRNDPLAQFLPHPGHRLPAFAEWFAQTVRMQLLSMNWWEKYLQRAYDSGLIAGGALVRDASSPSPSRALPAVYGELAARELAGIAAALVQQVTRQAGLAGITKQKPQLIYRAVLAAIRKVGMARLQAFVNFMVVKLHNAARLIEFRAAGIEQVGIIPERLNNLRPSRFRKRDHATLHDQEEITLSAAELILAAQERWKKRFAELVALHGEERALAILQREITAETAALAARVAEFKQRLAAETEAFVARRQAEGAAVEAERVAREAELARAYEAKQAEQAAAAAARAALPARLARIGAAFVNVLTAGDDRVCDVCDDIAAEGPYSLDEAQGLIPAHPNCRCVFVPAFDKRFAINRELATAT